MMSEERPIIFQGGMVRAILDGRKTQIRRIVKPAPYDNCQRIIQHGDEWLQVLLNGEDHELTLGDVSKRLKCPYGIPGDRIWVKEAWCSDRQVDDVKPKELSKGEPIVYCADGTWRTYGSHLVNCGHKRPSIFMMRWMSRIDLKITNIRLERLQDVSEEDAGAEGCPIPPEKRKQYADRNDTARAWYKSLMNQIHGPGTWDANPWVWVIEFERMQP